MPNKKLTSFTLLLLLGFIWGTGYSIARFAMTHDVPALGYSFWQSIGPAMLLGLIGFTRKKNIQITAPSLRYYLICGLTGIVIPNTNMYLAASHLPAGLLAVIVNTVPIIAYPLALAARLESFQWMRFIGILLAMTGLMLIVLPKSSLPSPNMFRWALAALITPLSFAFCSIYISRHRPRISDSLSLATGTLLASSLILTPIIIFSDNFYMLHLPLTTPDWVILLEIVLSSIGYILFYRLIKIAGPVYYSMVDTTVALTGLFWGYIIFHEKLNSWTTMAVLFIVLALIFVTKRQK